MNRVWENSPKQGIAAFKGLLLNIMAFVIVVIILAFLRPQYSRTYFYGFLFMLLYSFMAVLFKYSVCAIELCYDSQTVFLRKVNLLKMTISEAINFSEVDSIFSIEKESRNDERCWRLQIFKNKQKVVQIKEIDFNWTESELKDIHDSIQEIKYG